MPSARDASKSKRADNRQHDRSKGERHRTSGGKSGSPPTKIIIGTSVVFIVGGVMALIVYLASSSKGLTQACLNYMEREKNLTMPAEYNLCAVSQCEFDITTCDVPCPFGYLVPNVDTLCPVSCECSDKGLYHGDIRFITSQLPRMVEKYSLGEDRSDDEEISLFASTVRMAKGYGKWAVGANRRVTIPYFFVSDLDQSIRDKIPVVAKYFSKNSCIDLIPKTAAHRTRWLRIDTGTGCSAPAGLVITGIPARDAEQYINLKNKDCDTYKVIYHELYHIFGFDHEHNHPMRDNYIRVNFENIVTDAHSQFYRLKGKSADLGTTFDPKSLLHYHAWIFNKPGSTKDQGATMVDLKTNKPIPDGVQRPSVNDLKNLNAYYCQGKFDYASIPGLGALALPTPPGYKPYGGVWTQWLPWSGCVKTCLLRNFPDASSTMRFRFCKGGSGCVGNKREKKNCPGVQPCGGTSMAQWTSVWTQWAKCTKTCGAGKVMRQRTCSQVNKCSGETFSFKSCGPTVCSGGSSYGSSSYGSSSYGSSSYGSSSYKPASSYGSSSYGSSSYGSSSYKPASSYGSSSYGSSSYGSSSSYKPASSYGSSSYGSSSYKPASSYGSSSYGSSSSSKPASSYGSSSTYKPGSSYGTGSSYGSSSTGSSYGSSSSGSSYGSSSSSKPGSSYGTGSSYGSSSSGSSYGSSSSSKPGSSYGTGSSYGSSSTSKGTSSTSTGGAAKWAMEWTQWGVCDSTCGSAKKKRFRVCSVPNKCQGKSHDSKDCPVIPCPGATKRLGAGSVKGYGAGSSYGLGSKPATSVGSSYKPASSSGSSYKPASSSGSSYKPASSSGSSYKPATNVGSSYKPATNVGSSYKPASSSGSSYKPATNAGSSYKPSSSYGSSYKPATNAGSSYKPSSSYGSSYKPATNAGSSYKPSSSYGSSYKKPATNVGSSYSSIPSWGTYSSYSSCTRTCAPSFKTRTRMCFLNGKKAHGCAGSYYELTPCPLQFCGGFSDEDGAIDTIFSATSVELQEVCDSNAKNSWIFGDFNGDRKVDVLCGPKDGGSLVAGITTRGTELLAVSEVANLADCGVGQRLAADFDDDLLDDIVCSSEGKTHVKLMKDGEFTLGFDYTSAFCKDGKIMVLDSDGDGNKDLLCIGILQTSKILELMINQIF